MRPYLITVGLILGVSLFWVAVERVTRAFARRHPELGAYREEGSGCCGGCRGSCEKRRQD